MFETLRSLVRPFFGAIWGIVSGAFGWQAPVAGAISLFLSWAIFAALNPTASALAAVLAVSILLLINSTIAFWSFLIANGSAYQPARKGNSWQSVWLSSVVVALIWGFFSASIGLGVLNFFFDLSVWQTALANAVVTGTLVATITIGAIKSLITK
jgi:hypothetical protein